jgi:hypothetical protein
MADIIWNESVLFPLQLSLRAKESNKSSKIIETQGRMNILTPPRELFRTPDTSDKLSLFQSLFDASELNVDLALALLKVIHGELIREQSAEGSLYKRYARIIETLRYHKPEMLKEVIDAWKAGRTMKGPEWLIDGAIK